MGLKERAALDECERIESYLLSQEGCNQRSYDAIQGDDHFRACEECDRLRMTVRDLLCRGVLPAEVLSKIAVKPKRKKKAAQSAGFSKQLLAQFSDEEREALLLFTWFEDNPNPGIIPAVAALRGKKGGIKEAKEFCDGVREKLRKLTEK